MSDFIPSSDGLFNTWLENFQLYVQDHQDHLGFTAADMTVMDTGCTAWDVAYMNYTTALLAAKSTRATKETDRVAIESIVRSMVRRIQANPATTNADREALQITVPGAASEADVELTPSDDKPMATLDMNNRLMHIFKVQNQTSSGVKSGRPAGALGAEIWRKVGEAPASESEMTMVGIATRSQYVVNYAMEDGGKQVYYMMRWVNGKGEAGPWSETISATVAA